VKFTLRELPGLQRAAIEAKLPDLFDLGHEIEQEMKTHPWHNRTGITEREVASKVDNGTGVITVTANGHANEGKKVPSWLEFGTSRMHARPWMLPALIRVSMRRKFQGGG
jgi:hypothetical protein